MLLSQYGVDAVVQLSKSYISRVVANGIYQGTTCLSTQGWPVEFPDDEGMFRTRDFAFRPGPVKFEYDPDQDLTFIVVTLERAAGLLEVGDDWDSLSEADELSLRLRVQVDADNSDDSEIQIAVFFEPGSMVADQVDPEDLPVDDLRISVDDLALGDLNLALDANDPGEVTALDNGDLAIGLSLQLGGSSPPGTDLTKFRKTYDQDLLTGTTLDWGFGIDEWLVREFVEDADLAAGQGKLRNTSQTLDRITTDGLEISGSGEAYHDTLVGDWWEFSFEAEANLLVTDPLNAPPQVKADWEVTDVDLDSWVASLVDWLGFIDDSVKQASGIAVVVQNAAFGSSSDPQGRFTITDVLTAPGILAFIGDNSVEQLNEPYALTNPPSELVLGPACSGSRMVGTVSVRGPDGGGSRAPLTVCGSRIEGADEEAFEIVDEDDSRVVEGSQRWRVRIGASSGITDGNHQAELVIFTSAGEERVDLRLLLEGGSLSGVPDSLEFEARQERAWCDAISEEVAKTSFDVQAQGDGAVTVCSLRIENATGGRWSAWGASDGEVVAAGEQRTIEVMYEADVLDTWEEATLRIELAGGSTHQVSLRARVTKGREGHLMPPPGTNIGGFDFAAWGIDSDRLCWEIDALDEAIAAWDLINEDLGRIWDDPGIEPGCCPPPQQPMCLCEDWMEMEAGGLPPGTHLAVESEGRVTLEMEALDERAVILAPVVPGARPSLRLRPEGKVGGALTGTFRRWQVTRLTALSGLEGVRGVAGASGRIGVLREGVLELYGVDAEGAVEEHGRLEVPRDSAGVARFGRFLAVHGEEGVFLIDPGPDGRSEPRRVSAPASDALIELRGAGQGRESEREHPSRALGVTGDTVRLLDFSDLDRPVELLAHETPIAARLGQRFGSRLVLAGERGVEFLELPTEEEARSLGVVELPGVASMITNGTSAWAVDRGRGGHMVGVANGEARVAGRLSFPEEWGDALPGGALSPFDADRVVAASPEGDGFNVFSVRSVRNERR